MIIDSHGHYSRYNFEQTFHFLSVQDGEYRIAEGNRDAVIEDIHRHQIVGVVEASVDMASNQKMLRFAEENKGFVFPAVGVHPTRTSLCKWRDRKDLEEMVRRNPIVAIGETGLDYHLPRRQQKRIRQYCWFIYQILLADRYHLPLILHIRDAHKQAIRVLKLFRRKLHGGVVHCFYGTSETAAQYFDLGFCIGIGGALLQSERGGPLREAVEKSPLDRILAETDAPYVLPDLDCCLTRKQRRRIRNTSSILPKVIETIAELKHLNAVEAENVIFDNTVRVFALDRFGLCEKSDQTNDCRDLTDVQQGNGMDRHAPPFAAALDSFRGI